MIQITATTPASVGVNQPVRMPPSRITGIISGNAASAVANTTWRSGALQGTTAKDAFFVKCDRTTMTQDDIDNGRLICVIGIAPVKPAEFVIFRIQQFTQTTATA